MAASNSMNEAEAGTEVVSLLSIQHHQKNSISHRGVGLFHFGELRGGLKREGEFDRLIQGVGYNHKVK